MFKNINPFEKKVFSKEIILVSFLISIYFVLLFVVLVGIDFASNNILFLSLFSTSIFISIPLSFFPVKALLKAFSLNFNKLYSYIILCLFNLVLLFLILTILYLALNANYLSYIEMIANFLIISILPIFITFYFLESNLYRSMKDSYQEYLKDEIVENSSSLILIQSDTKEKLTLEEDKLCFIKSEQNYSNVFYFNKKDELVSVLLRISLKKVEKQIQQNSNFVRFHNSFIVNTAYIVDVSGNSKSYKLKVKNSDIEIPVSRNFSKEVIENLKEKLG